MTKQEVEQKEVEQKVAVVKTYVDGVEVCIVRDDLEVEQFDESMQEKLAKAYENCEFDVVGIFANATLHSMLDPQTALVNNLQSGGCWGIQVTRDNNDDEKYLKELATEELEDLEHILCSLGLQQNATFVQDALEHMDFPIRLGECDNKYRYHTIVY